MRTQNFARGLNWVWVLALAAFFTACNQMEGLEPDNANLEASEQLALLNSLNNNLYNARFADCNGPTVEPRTDLTGPGGNVECSQTGDYEFSSGRVNYDEDTDTFDNNGNWPEGFTVHTDGTFVSWEFTPFRDKDGVLQCLKDLSVIVKGGPAANVYTYSNGEASDCNLVSPDTPGGSGPAGLSNLTFCFNLEPCDEEPCFDWFGESATGRGQSFSNTRPATWFQWNTRDQLISGVDLVYGRQLQKAGRVTISDLDVEGMRTITVSFDEGFRLAQDPDGNIVGGALKVFASDTAFTQFRGFSGALQSNTATIRVPNRANYFVHVDIEEKREVECEVED